MFHIFSQPLFRKSDVRRSDRRRSKFQPVLDGLEKREVLATSINQVGNVVAIIADPGTSNSATATMAGGVLDVNLNGKDVTFAASSVGMISFDASNTIAGTSQTFVNSTSKFGFAVGGAGTNHFVAGSGFDCFLGGNGVNQFDAGTGYVIFIGNATGDNTFNLGSGSGFVMGFGGKSHVNAGTGNYSVYGA